MRKPPSWSAKTPLVDRNSAGVACVSACEERGPQRKRHCRLVARAALTPRLLLKEFSRPKQQTRTGTGAPPDSSGFVKAAISAQVRLGRLGCGPTQARG